MNETIQDSIKIGKILSESRYRSGLSQEYMAMGIGVSKPTIINWEKGSSSPNLKQALQWFRLVGENPMSPFLELLYPDTFNDIGSNTDDEDIYKALHNLINNLPPKIVRQILYIFAGNHGSSPISILQMITAHLHTTIRARTLVAQLISDNYELCEKCGDIVCEENVRPDIPLLDRSIALGKEAAARGHNGYSSNKLNI